MESRLQERRVVKIIRRLCRCVLLPYLAMVLWLTLLNRVPTHPRCKLTPFWEYRNVLNGYNRNYYFWQIVGNLVMLLPLGFMLPMLSDHFKKGWRTIGLVCLSSVAIELTQWFTARGLMEFDDVFNNTVGGAVGYILFCIFMYFAQRHKKS